MVGKPEVVYNPKAGRYVYADTKRFVPEAVIRHLVDTEQQQLGVRLQALTRLLDAQKIDLPEWETRFAQTLKDSHLRMLTLGAGGKDSLTPRHYGAAGYQLGQQYKFLDRFANQISGGTVSTAQAMRRSKQYAASIRVTFGKAQQISRIAEGFNEARRRLDPQAQHCSDCVTYAALGWTWAELLPPAGTNCACSQYCRCSIVYRKGGKTSPLTQAGILN